MHLSEIADNFTFAVRLLQPLLADVTGQASWYNGRMKQPDYHSLENLLEMHELSATPAELHGALCVHLSVNDALQPADWLKQALGSEVGTRPWSTELERSLNALFEHTARAVEDALLSFMPYLPDDHADLRDRTEAMSEWCQGYLVAAQMNGMGADESLSDDVQDFLEDLTELSVADIGGSGDQDEDNEQAWFELVEYLRVGTVLVYEMCRSPEQDTPSIH